MMMMMVVVVMLLLLMIIPAFSRHVRVLLECRTTTLGCAKSLFCFLYLMAITNGPQHDKFCMEIILVNTSKNLA
jgi:hypothetical protein